MKQDNKQGRKNIPQKKTVAKPPPVNKQRQGLLTQLDKYFQGKRNFWFLTSCVLCLLFSVLLFDVKMSNAYDDSMYVQAGYKIAHDMHNIYAANAPLYPMFLSIPIGIFGLKIILLKSLSVILILLNIVFLYLAFRNRVNDSVLFLVMLTVSVNSYFLYFASQTFNEAFFLFLQGALVYFMAKNYDSLAATTSIKQTWKGWLLIGFLAFLLSISKNVALLGIAAIILFLLLEKKFIQAVYAAVSFLLFRIPFQLLGNALAGKSQYTSQSSIILQVDPYNPSKGMETLGGFVDRFFRNGALYLSRRFFQILGFQSEDSLKVNGGISVFLVLIFLVAVFFIIRNKNKILLFVSVYSAVMLAGTFTALQVQWDQPRFVMVYVPFILLVIYSGWYYMFRKSSIGQFFLVAIACIVLGSGAFAMVDKAESNFSILKRNLSGDIYYGYTPDWINYLKMSEYCADSLPANSLVGARKAPMSFIYGRGKEFYGIATAFSDNADTILANFKENNVTHILMASLRRNPKHNDGYVINTIQRLLYPVTQKYPQKLVMVKQIGESEPAYLYKINY
jgi:hypothetical protein